MNMGSAGFIKHPGNENFIRSQDGSADRTGTPAVSLETVRAARDMHEPVIASQGWKGGGFYPFPRFQAGGTDRAGSGRPGKTFPMGLLFGPPVPGRSGARGIARRVSGAKKQGIPEPEEENAYKHKSKYL
jgi:hypothetical protein